MVCNLKLYTLCCRKIKFEYLANSGEFEVIFRWKTCPSTGLDTGSEGRSIEDDFAVVDTRCCARKYEYLYSRVRDSYLERLFQRHFICQAISDAKFLGIAHSQQWWEKDLGAGRRQRLAKRERISSQTSRTNLRRIIRSPCGWPDRTSARCPTAGSPAGPARRAGSGHRNARCGLLGRSTWPSSPAR